MTGAAPRRGPGRPRTPELSAAFAARLVGLIRGKGHSVDTFARETGVHRGSLFRLVNGSRQPSAEMAARLASALEVSADYLLGLRDDPAPLRRR